MTNLVNLTKKIMSECFELLAPLRDSFVTIEDS